MYYQSSNEKYIFVSFFPESARWLLSHGNGEKAEKIIRKVAKVNKRKLPEPLFTEDEIQKLVGLQLCILFCFVFIIFILSFSLFLFFSFKTRRWNIPHLYIVGVVCCSHEVLYNCLAIYKAL